MEHFGGVDVLVNNAAKYSAQDFADLSIDEWDAFSATNIDAFVHLAQAALPELEKTGGNLVAVGVGLRSAG